MSYYSVFNFSKPYNYLQIPAIFFKITELVTKHPGKARPTLTRQ